MKVRGFIGESRMSSKERRKLSSLIKGTKLFIEVGTYHGTTIAYWAKRNPKTTFLSIDIFVKGSSISYWYKNHQVNNHLFVGSLGELVMLGLIPTQEPCVTFIDGDHLYYACLLDLTMANLISDTIWVHDYTKKRKPGVKKAVDRFIEKTGKTLELVETTAIIK